MVGPVTLPVQRSPRQTLHHVWAPKLRRIVMLTGQAQLHLWAMLEAHPGVTQYCERPASPEAAQALPFATFGRSATGAPFGCASQKCLWKALLPSIASPRTKVLI